MKTRKIAAAIALAAALAVTPVLGACSGDHYSKIEFPEQTTTYAVTSQGGNAVAYGNYVYFINGTRGYDDDSGESNVWPNVVKGALYRAELNGSDVTEEDEITGKKYTVFAPAVDKATGIEFKSTAGKDYDDNDINVVNVTSIAPKTIGTSGYANGGIFIYDDYLYFATPNNQQNSVGEVQTKRTDFFMMPLKGGAPVKLYTTAEGVDTSSSAYAFYKYGGAVYLVVNEDADIISVKINTKKEKAEETVKFEVGATSVYFPVRDTYYDGIDNNTPEDFIYYVRDVRNDESKPTSGTVIEAMRPDGSEGFIVSKNGQTETIEAVRDGVLFYRTTVASATKIAYNNLHEDLMTYSPTYREAQNAITESKRNRQISGVFYTDVTSSITSTYAYRPDKLSNEVYIIGSAGSTINRYSVDGTVENICGSTGTLMFVKDNYIYYGDGSTSYYRSPLYSNMDGFGTVRTITESATSATLAVDYVSGYFTYFGAVDEWASGYMMFNKVDGREGLEPQFVGTRTSDDVKPEE